MNVYLSNLWNHLKASFWLLPASMTILVMGFSFITLNWDRVLDSHDITHYSIWQGGAEGARQLLTTIAGSVTTITGVVFSITVVSLSLASTQYGSRILKNFMQDFGTQFVLGVFVSTSAYALLILRTIRNDEHHFIPNLSITVSIGFFILSLLMLIYFIHHVGVRIQSADVIARVAGDLIKMIDSSMENASTSKLVNHILLNPQNKKNEILSSQEGYLQAIDYKSLYRFAQKQGLIIDVCVRPSHFLKKESVLAHINTANLSTRKQKLIAKTFIVGRERSPTQDIEYAIDQLVTIALRALGLNANDIFTANSCIDHLGLALSLLCKKELTPPYYTKNPLVRLVSNQITFRGVVDASFTPIRQYGLSNPSILIHILETLTSILPHTRLQEQKNALKKHADMLKNAGNELFEEKDRKDVQKRYNEFNETFMHTLNS